MEDGSVRHRGEYGQHMNISHQNPAHQAGEHLFLQPIPTIPRNILINEGSGISAGMDQLFTMTQLSYFNSLRHQSSCGSGPDGVTRRDLRNLPKKHRLPLLNMFNDV